MAMPRSEVRLRPADHPEDDVLAALDRVGKYRAVREEAMDRVERRVRWLMD